MLNPIQKCWEMWRSVLDGAVFYSSSSFIFWNFYFFHAQLGLDSCPDMKPLYSLQVFLSNTILPHNLQIFTGQHPIISSLSFQMPKLSQSATLHHLSHVLNTQKTVKDFTTYPSETLHVHIHMLSSALQATQIFRLHRPYFSPICIYKFYILVKKLLKFIYPEQISTI